MSVSKSVLLVEDEQDIADILTLHLRDMGCQVTHTLDGAIGLAEAVQSQWDLILLDLSLPHCDGLTICRQIRQANPLTPVVIITARSSEADRVLGLESGADDYLIKPFSVTELIARINALFRRIDAMQSTIKSDEVPPESKHETLMASDILLCPATHKVTVGELEVTLTAREFDLLMYFAHSPGTVFKRAELLEKVWGYSHNGYLHTVNSHINRLRAKIEPDPAAPKYIQTVWGVGYKFASSV